MKNVKDLREEKKAKRNIIGLYILMLIMLGVGAFFLLILRDFWDTLKYLP